MADRRRHQATVGALVGLCALSLMVLAVTSGDQRPAGRAASTTTSSPRSTASTSTTSSSTTGAPTTVPETVAPTTATPTTDPAPATTAAPTSKQAPEPATKSAANAGRPAPRLPWFGASATWNRPVSDFGPSATLQEYAARLWNFGGGAAPAGTINVAFGDYSVPVYPVTEATTVARIYQTTWSMNMYGFGVPLGTQIPWNPAWHPGGGNDNLMAIVDEATGKVWELGGVGQQKANCANWANVNTANAIKDESSTYVCLYGANIYDNLFTATDAVTVDGRGAGINKLALLTRADEVKAGSIRHALEMTVTSTMFGPACSPVNGATATGAGVSCGYFLPPAKKLERINPDTGCPGRQEVTDGERSKTVPEGMRFALHVSDAEIDQWLDSRGYTGRLRSTARVFAVALRDYGWIVAETGCWGMHIETDSVIGTQGSTWADLGVSSNGSSYPHGDLLAGLFSPERIYVVEPPA